MSENKPKTRKTKPTTSVRDSVNVTEGAEKLEEHKPPARARRQRPEDKSGPVETTRVQSTRQERRAERHQRASQETWEKAQELAKETGTYPAESGDGSVILENKPPKD